MERAPLCHRHGAADGEVLGNFETYWNDTTYQDYDPDDHRDRDRPDDALAQASGHRQTDRATLSLSGLDVRPYPY
jgi:hypothetical protein